MGRMRLYKGRVCVVFFVFFACGIHLFADTVKLRNGGDIRGIVVEEYRDRVIVSTHEGEKEIFRKNILDILYDLPEQNLLKLGDACMGRREYEKAYFYYEKAHYANPSNRNARDKMNYVMGHLFRKRERGKEADVKRRKDFEIWPQAEKFEEDGLENRLEDVIGVKLNVKKNRMTITSVRNPSVAYKAGLRENDALISVWGRLTGYMSTENVAQILMNESFGEIKIEIEREVIIEKDKRSGKPYRSILGAGLIMSVEGLTVSGVAPGGKAEEAGLKSGDFITAIDGISTRYMPLKNAIKMLEDPKHESIAFTAKREVTIWRK